MLKSAVIYLHYSYLGVSMSKLHTCQTSSPIVSGGSRKVEKGGQPTALENFD